VLLLQLPDHNPYTSAAAAAAVVFSAVRFRIPFAPGSPRPPPPPAGVAHVPSPRQNVDELAPVPLFKFAAGKFPATSAVRLTAEMLSVTTPAALLQCRRPLAAAPGLTMR
jgi:hypothetical protein